MTHTYLATHCLQIVILSCPQNSFLIEPKKCELTDTQILVVGGIQKKPRQIHEMKINMPIFFKIHNFRGFQGVAIFSSRGFQGSYLWPYGVVVSMFDFHRSDQGSNPDRGGKIYFMFMTENHKPRVHRRNARQIGQVPDETQD